MPANLRSIKSARIFPLPEWYLPKGTTNASDQRLEEASSSCERWGIGFAGIVVVAVIAELIIAWIQPPYLLFLTESAFSDAVIAIGIAGEVLLGTIWNNHIQTELRRRSNERLGSAVQSAGEATARAEEARLEIARLSTPRVRLLTPEACEAIVAKMLPFRGTRIVIGHAENGREQWDFCWAFEPLIRQAHWQFLDWNPGPLPLPGHSRAGVFVKVNWTMQHRLYGVANVSNISIELNPENRDELLPAATALAGALNGVGIAAVVEPHPISGISGIKDAVHFLVGDRE